jgi:hypothetical protein
MEFKANLADGERLGTVLLAPTTVIDLVERRCRRRPDLKSSTRARAGSLFDVLAAGLLLDCCGLTGRRATELLDADRATVHHRMTVHRDFLVADVRYRRIVVHVVRRARERDLPPRRHALDLEVRIPALERGAERASED